MGEIQLFFALTPKGMQEYEGKKRHELGHYAVMLLNEFLSNSEESDSVPHSLAEMTGFTTVEANFNHLWALVGLSAYLVKGRKWKDIINTPVKTDIEIEQYFNNTRPELWLTWYRLKILPYSTEIRGRNSFGWYVKANNVFEAATAELVFAFMYSIKQPFKYCNKHNVFYFEACPYCTPEKELKKRFLGLLRMHKFRILENILTVEDGREEYVLSEIERINRKAQKGSLKQAIREYIELCRENALPTDWFSNYDL
ncbi:hypothetical protein [Thermoanaerobacter uzonensis]|uniref:hypothetical protein n=1 Tax=Thermoanaerobacter uzonensis TaxID=447593 RepID=UPI003D76695C